MVAPKSPMDKNQGEKKRRSIGLAMGLLGTGKTALRRATGLTEPTAVISRVL